MHPFEVVLVGLVGIAVAGLIAGTLIVVVGRRRDAAEAARRASRDGRARRRPPAPLGEDPIVAALGVGGDGKATAPRRMRS
jgi:hypothetical protein